MQEDPELLADQEVGYLLMRLMIMYRLKSYLINMCVRIYRFKASFVLFIESTMYIVPQCIVPQKFNFLSFRHTVKTF